MELQELSDAISNPRAVVIYGASDDPNKIGGRPIAYMLEHGFSGRVIPVNPKRKVIQGLECFASLADAGGHADAAIVIVPGKLALKAVTEAAESGVRVCVVISSGFGEGGDTEGRKILDEMLSVSRQHGMRLVGPNAQGLVSFHTGSILSFSTLISVYPPSDGPVAIVSQSGAMASVPYGMLREREIGVRYAHATGNDSDLDLADLALLTLADPEIRILILYIENMPSTARLQEVSQEAATRGIPVFVLYGGLTEAGQRAALSHTGAMASESRTVEAFFRRNAMWLAESLEEIVDAVPLWLSGNRPTGNGLGILSSSGASCVLVSDSAAAFKLAVPSFDAATQSSLVELLPAFAATSNPVDITSALLSGPSLLGQSADLIASDPATGSLIVALPVTGPGYAVEQFATDLAEVQRKSGKAVVAVLPNRRSRELFDAEGIPTFEETHRAVRALGGLVHQTKAMADKVAQTSGPVPDVATTPTVSGSKDRLDIYLVNEVDSVAILSNYGVRFAQSAFFRDPTEITPESLSLFPGETVLKGVTSAVSHKSEYGLVQMSVSGVEEISHAALSIAASAADHNIPLDGFVVYEKVESSLEMIIGGRTDDTFGPVLMVGMGGKLAEVDPDVVVLVPPLSVNYVVEELFRLRSSKLLKGFRDIPPVNLKVLAESVVGVMRFMEDHPGDIESIEVNPLLIDGDQCVGVDAVINAYAGFDAAATGAQRRSANVG